MLSIISYLLFFRLASLHAQSSCNVYEKTLPQPLWEHQMIYYEPKNTVYLFGGMTGPFKYSSKVYKWDLSIPDDWFHEFTVNNTIVTTPTSEFYSCTNNVVLINDTAYFIGVYSSYTKFYVFDLLTESWVSNNNLTPPPYPVYLGCITSNNTHIFMVGGRNRTYTLPTNHLQIYDIINDNWYSEEIELNPLDEGWACQYCTQNIMDNILYVFGGYILAPNYPLDGIYKYTQLNGWEYVGDKSTESSSGNAVYYNSQIYIIGGEIFWTSKIDIFDLKNESIINTENMIDALGESSSLIIKDTLYIFGGQTSGNKAVDMVQVCHLIGRQS